MAGVRNNDGVPVEGLRSRLEAAAANSGAAALLVALAELDPDSTAAWMIEHRVELEAVVGSADLKRLLGRLIGEWRDADGAPKKLCFELAEAFEEVAPVDAMAGLVADAGSSSDPRSAVILQRALDRNPGHAQLLRAAIAQARDGGDAAAFHAHLTRLGRADPSQATVHWIARQRSELEPAATAPAAKVALLSSFTIDLLVPFLDLEVRDLGLTPTLYVAPFNSWAQEIIGESSGLHRFDPEVVVLAVSADDLVPGLDRNMSADELDRAGDDAVDRLVGIAGRFASVSDAVLIVHSLVSAQPDPLGVAAGQGGRDRGGWLTSLNTRLAAELGRLPHAYLLDVQDLLMRRRQGEFDNPKMRLLAGMRFVGPVLAELAAAYARYIAPARGLTRKCVVLDLDNTLWGGIVGEDGPTGIRLGDTSPGAEYREFQRYLEILSDRGILLAIASKNNEDDALEVIREHEHMVLREDAFSAMRINWRPKPENVLGIAEELNIGVDSLVFIDDNPHERELMRQALPDVLTPELPSDPALYRRTLESLPQLQTLVITDTDRARVEQYRAKRHRDDLRDTTQSLDSYLESLDITVRIAEADEASLPRTHQLFQRTNQFNLTTRRYDAGEISAFAESAEWRLYTLRARDRFGDHGLVAAALVHSGDQEWAIDSFLMSCRVISYGIETALLHAVVDDARQAGANVVAGEVIETAKNAPARDLYERHGFAPDGGDNGADRWRLSLDEGSVDKPGWIQCERSLS